MRYTNMWLAGLVVLALGCSSQQKQLDELVGNAGNMSTDLAPDLEPQRRSTEEKLETLDTDAGSFQCTITEYSITKVPEEFVALNPNADVLWPGSIVQGKSIARGILDPVPVARAPGKVTLTLASAGSDARFREIEEPSLATATQAISEILGEYEGGTPAKFSYKWMEVHSTKQLAVAIDANVGGSNWEVTSALSFDKDDHKNQVLLEFSQEYYTMAFEPPQGAAGVFAPSVTAADLAPYVEEGNPPVYVASVTYGRIFYLLFESTASMEQLTGAVSGSYSGFGVNAGGSASAARKQVINESTIRSYGLGGNAQEAIRAATGYQLDSSEATQFDVVKAFLVKGGSFGPESPGVPISYSLRHLADGSQVKLALTTEYEARDCEPIVVGCDGVADSGKVNDKCGVCGGDGTTCDPCPKDSFVYRAGNGAYVRFHVPHTSHGGKKTFKDGKYAKYIFPNCRRILWRDMEFACSDGTWSTPGTHTEDIWCDVENETQSDMETGVN